ncbi:MAG: type I phosphomannose isomerase catalytic subunit [Bacteroidales bacterium]
MTEIYPLKFEPILVEKIWGGTSLASRWGKTAGHDRKIGESWEISGVPGNISVVSNGFLAGNNLQELIEVYMGDITGEAVFEKFGSEFPLLIKLIEARDDLSIQVHPGDEMARERHKTNGKTEMWYILESDNGAKIYSGFSKPVTKSEYLEAVANGTLEELMNAEISKPGDVFFTPSGRIHAIGSGNILAEIQQSSDVTYRIFDWNRKNPDGTARELHTELATDAIDYNAFGNSVTRKEPVMDGTVNLVSCDYFVTNFLQFSNPLQKDYNLFDSFVIFICTGGEFSIHWEKGTEVVKKGETVLLPAMLPDVILEPRPEARVLEVFINSYPVSK